MAVAGLHRGRPGRAVPGDVHLLLGLAMVHQQQQGLGLAPAGRGPGHGVQGLALRVGDGEPGGVGQQGAQHVLETGLHALQLVPAFHGVFRGGEIDPALAHTVAQQHRVVRAVVGQHRGGLGLHVLAGEPGLLIVGAGQAGPRRAQVDFGRAEDPAAGDFLVGPARRVDAFEAHRGAQQGLVLHKGLAQAHVRGIDDQGAAGLGIGQKGLAQGRGHGHIAHEHDHRVFGQASGLDVRGHDVEGAVGRGAKVAGQHVRALPDGRILAAIAGQEQIEIGRQHFVRAVRGQFAPDALIVHPAAMQLARGVAIVLVHQQGQARHGADPGGVGADIVPEGLEFRAIGRQLVARGRIGRILVGIQRLGLPAGSGPGRRTGRPGTGSV